MIFAVLDVDPFWYFVPIMVGVTPFLLMWVISKLNQITSNTVEKGKNTGGK